MQRRKRKMVECGQIHEGKKKKNEKREGEGERERKKQENVMYAYDCSPINSKQTGLFSLYFSPCTQAASNESV